MYDNYRTLIFHADSYKYSHFKQYPEGIQNNNSYIESRGINPDQNMIPKDAEIVFFGLQMFLKKYLSTPIDIDDVNKVEKMILSHGLSFNRDGWVEIIKKFNGYLPIEIWSIPEGTVLEPKNVLVQVRSTHPDFAWLASFVETAILRSIWYPSTVATLSREIKKVIVKYLKITSDVPVSDQIGFKLHDFGARGASSAETAAIGGLAHLVNFMGTDTVEALWYASDYYNVDGPVGFSINSSEHSTMTALGKEGEEEQFRNMLEKYGGEGKMFSCVSDSYNIYHAVSEIWGKNLKQEVLDSGSILVVRPDSNDPVTTPIFCINELGNKYGYTTNTKGYKVLHPQVRVIQGDGINPNIINEILEKLTNIGWSTENITFGMGGALLQKVDRDTLNFAMKTSAMMFNDEWKDVYKSPVGQDMKKSKKGILALVKRDGRLTTIREDEIKENEKNYLNKVWVYGNICREMNFDEVRKNAEIK